MEHEQTSHLVQLQCFVPEAEPPNFLTFTVGTDWPISHLRSEVQISMGEEAPAEFTFFYSVHTGHDFKINRRKEKTMTVANVLSPKVLKIKNC